MALLVLFFLLSFTPLVLGANVTGYETPADGVKLNLYLLILGLAFGFIFLGGFTGSPLLATAGLVALLFASFIMLEGQVLIPSGDNYKVYGNNFSLNNGSPTYHWDYGDPPTYNPSDKTALLFHEREEFEAWDDNNSAFLGFVMIIVTIILMFSLVAGLSDD